MNANDRLKKIRNDLNLSQNKFAEKLEIPSSSINNIELYKGRVTPEIAKKVEEVFNVNLRWLLFGENEQTLTNQPSESPDNIKIVKLKKGQLLKIEYED